MKPYLVAFLLVAVVACSVSKVAKDPVLKIPAGTYEDTLRYLYSRPAKYWPPPCIDSGTNFSELAVLPESPIEPYKDSLKHKIALGKMLFFDPRLSKSNMIACATCHKPELSWTDGRSRSIGHDSAINKRNSPSIQNVWFYHKLFWDGRSSSLEDQAFSPINSETEMSSDMPQATGKLRRIKGYQSYFEAAFGDHEITPEEITEALAVFQRTIISNKSSFDIFMQGNSKALTDAQLRGLQLFRTKARCINCHNGALFSDNSFHNTGLAGNDDGLFFKTKITNDKGKFKTPSLRDVMKTGPWLHDGSITQVADLIEHYNRITQRNRTDKLLVPLHLSSVEKADILAFLQSISSDPVPFNVPQLPE